MSADTAAVSFIVRVPTSHPSLPGHFPGQPIVPGVVLLDLIVAALPTPMSSCLASIPSAKFLSPVLPGESIDVRVSISDPIDGRRRAHAAAHRGDAAVLDATLIFTVNRA